MAPKSGAVKAETGECAAIPAILRLKPQYPSSAQKEGRFATAGPYAHVRHPQYVAFIVIMIGYYRFSGLLAVGALMLFVLYTLAFLAGFDAVLTLPGLAGLVLSVGMAVDANVLIFERIREELDRGKTVRTAIEEGFQHALSAIVDTSVTTILTAAVLYQYGTGPVRGFAVTLIAGISASLFAAVFITRTFYLVWLTRARGAPCTSAARSRARPAAPRARESLDQSRHVPETLPRLDTHPAVLALALFFQYTRIGRALRAVADDHQAALSVGIPLKHIWAIVWAVAGFVALVAGLMWGARNGVQFALTFIALKALPVLLIGGFESVPGAIIGGLIIGASEKLAEVYLGPLVGGGIESWFAYVIALLFLLVRPQGLFGEKIIDRV